MDFVKNKIVDNDAQIADSWALIDEGLNEIKKEKIGIFNSEDQIVIADQVLQKVKSVG
jgi:hypothetical protein